MVSKKFANLYKFGKHYRWPTQDCLSWSDHCNLLFLHESMLWIDHCKSTLSWLNVRAKMWITFNVQNTSKSGWTSSSFFYPEKVFFYPFRLGKKTSFFIIIFLWEKITKNFNVTIYFGMGATFYQKTRKIPYLVLEILKT